jgi:hypothetical protein
MKYSTKRLSLLGSLLLAGVTCVNAELIGLQVADTANLRDPGQLEFIPGAVMSKDLSFYGVRQTYSFTEGFRAFLDLGAVDFDKNPLDFAGSLGVTVCIPSDFLADLAFRTSLYYANTDAIDIVGGNMALISSDETLLDDLYIYAAFGADFSQTEEAAAKATTTTTEINPLLSLGLTYNFTQSVGIYVETTYVTSMFYGFGIKIR